MARSNGPFGPAGTRPPARRHPADDPYAAPTGQPNGQWPGPGQGAQQQGQGYHFPPEPDPNYGYNNQQAQAPFDGYQGPNGAQQPQQWGQEPDPRGYDLGNYMPNAAQPYPPMDPAQFQPGPGHAHYNSQQAYAETDADADYEDDFVDDEPRAGRRWSLIAVALVGAIGVGGVLAYSYKSFIAPSSGRVPVVKAGDPNVKIKPENRGGKEFPNADKKMLSRLSDDQQRANPEAEPQDERAGDDTGGPRRVRTIPIAPGSGPPAAQPPPPSPTVPGIMLETRAQPPPRAAPPTPRQRVTLGQPPPPPAAVEDTPPPARRPPVQAAPAPAKPQPQPQLAKPAPPPPQQTASAGAGFVAVLSSQKSRIDALKVFADLQQKYADALSGRTPDVQEADLSARGLGTMYRLVIGPPGSRDAASGVCSQIKAAGYQGCWVMGY